MALAKNCIWISILLVVYFICSCEKLEKKENKIIEGIFFNSGTNEPYVNAKIKFIESKSKNSLFGKSSVKTLETTTDKYGNFSFSTLVSSKSNYTYYIYVPEEENQIYGYESFNIQIENINTLEDKIILSNTGTFKMLYLSLPNGIIINSPDSFFIDFKQYTFHLNNPSPSTWNFSINSKNNNTNHAYNTGNEIIQIIGMEYNHVMGPWQVSLQKWKNGVYSITEDSIYLEMGGTHTYEIPW